MSRKQRFSPGILDALRRKQTHAFFGKIYGEQQSATYGKTMLYGGIWNNVFNCLAGSFPRLGGRLIGVCPIINPAAISPKEIKEIVKNTEHPFQNRFGIELRSLSVGFTLSVLEGVRSSMRRS